ncbi:hypothetical protein [Jannaschia sp. R86511]|uniref:hypothetical protein n=1 Tax=Jannaschia sp. R86511 TaxID=3093853 RepID=UPI0036D41D83
MVPRVVPTAVAALGLVLAVVGVVVLTLAAPDQQVGGRTQAATVLTTGPGVAALTGEPLEVQVGGEAFVGVGRQADVTAWLAGVAHIRVDGVASTTTLRAVPVDGAEPGTLDPSADPEAADVWQQEVSGASPRLRLEAPRADQALVVVTAGPDAVDLRWERSATHPGAWPLLLGGVLLLALGLAWLVALNARRARLARRSRPRPRPRDPAGRA